MAKFELNKQGLEKLSKQAELVTAEAIQAAAGRGSGKSPAEVEVILREELTKRRITPGKDVGEIARRIAAG